MKITVIGAGYVGLVTGVSLAASGRHDVTFVERNPSRLDEIRDGRMPIEEPGLTDAFRDARDRIAVVDALAAAEAPDVVFVAVATPIGEDGESDLGQILSALEDLRAFPGLHVSVRPPLTLVPGCQGYQFAPNLIRVVVVLFGVPQSSLCPSTFTFPIFPKPRLTPPSSARLGDTKNCTPPDAPAPRPDSERSELAPVSKSSTVVVRLRRPTQPPT